MIGSLLGALLAALISVFLIDSLVYMGVFSTYIKSYEIGTYYNPFFWDNQNFLVLLVLTVVFFLLYSFKQTQKLGIATLIVCSLVASSTFISIIGESAGEWMFYQKDVQITTTNNNIMNVDIVFSDRNYVYLKARNGEIIKALREKSEN